MNLKFLLTSLKQVKLNMIYWLTYEYLTADDVRYKSGVVEKAKFEYSPLGNVFNKGLDRKDKKEGLLKIFKNIEGKNEDKLK